ncbi:hypothetical protein GCM10011519_14340 [Marmoricola endophyticus]|uniref:Uncharacterized protein n=1 Tax=Marmoricola endophyticus TaxID=2040280 RepID=A0A917BH77_9ACTN|nr:hypothetical protein GCM10011519_14340 [Marmoricola endophyticus]
MREVSDQDPREKRAGRFEEVLIGLLGVVRARAYDVPTRLPGSPGTQPTQILLGDVGHVRC